MVNIDYSRDELLTTFSKETLGDRYLLPGETPQDAFARVAEAYSSDPDHAQRLYDYMSKLWFVPSTPVLANGGADRGLPISCFLNEVEDDLEDIIKTWEESAWLGAKGGGIGTYWGNIRSVGERVGKVGHTSGVIPFMKVQDSLTLAISQGSQRRGSSAAYLPVSHPEIEEFVEIRRPTGGDPKRKADFIHNAVVISDEFMEAVDRGDDWSLKSPKDGQTKRVINARDLWIRILTARIETGEPYILFIDNVNRQKSNTNKLLNLPIKMSNLCSEIVLPTGIDHLGRKRTAVCCLSSVNVEKFDEWRDDPQFIHDIMEMLDNVLQDFIERAPSSMKNAVYSAIRERSVGLGAMGFHSFLQKNGIPFESAIAKAWNKRIFSHLQDKTHTASLVLAKMRGPAPDCDEAGLQLRFSNTMAVAPNASSSIIAGAISPSIEPLVANSYTHKTLSGSFNVKNKYLKKLLQEKGMDTTEVWRDIHANDGSVQHLDFLTVDEKAVFKTAFEIDQRWVIEHAADRTPFIDQAASTNIFLLANTSKKVLHDLHRSAWAKGLKSLYYCRSRSIQRAEVISQNKHMPLGTPETQENEECLSCQG